MPADPLIVRIDLSAPAQGESIFDLPDVGQADSSPIQDAPEQVIWEMALPGRLPVAQGRLEKRLARLEQAQRALPWAEERLEYFVARAPAITAPPPPVGQRGAYSSYAVAVEEAASSAWSQAPEADLQRLLWEQQAAGMQYAAGALDYASPREIVDKIKRAVQRVDSLARRLGLLMAPKAVVRTRPERRLLATTSIDWLGQMQTCYVPEVTGEIITLHQAALQTFLVDRQAWLRLGILTVANSLKLVARLPSGLGAVTAIPGIIDFIEQVIEQFRQLEESPGGP